MNPVVVRLRLCPLGTGCYIYPFLNLHSLGRSIAICVHILNELHLYLLRCIEVDFDNLTQANPHIFVLEIGRFFSAIVPTTTTLPCSALQHITHSNADVRHARTKSTNDGTHATSPLSCTDDSMSHPLAMLVILRTLLEKLLIDSVNRRCDVNLPIKRRQLL